MGHELRPCFLGPAIVFLFHVGMNSAALHSWNGVLVWDELDRQGVLYLMGPRITGDEMAGGK